LIEDENERVIAEIVEQANLRNLDKMLEYFADDVTAQWPWGEKWGKEDIREIFKRSFKIWSDGVYRVNRVISKGDIVAAEVHWTGVQTGEWVRFGIPATGRSVELVEVWIVDLVGGKVKVFKVFYNPDLVVQQLRK
jgi:predicted ester cyclase